MSSCLQKRSNLGVPGGLDRSLTGLRSLGGIDDVSAYVLLLSRSAG